MGAPHRVMSGPWGPHALEQLKHSFSPSGSSRPCHKGKVDEPWSSTWFRGPRDPSTEPRVVGDTDKGLCSWWVAEPRVQAWTASVLGPGGSSGLPSLPFPESEAFQRSRQSASLSPVSV